MEYQGFERVKSGAEKCQLQIPVVQVIKIIIIRSKDPEEALKFPLKHVQQHFHLARFLHFQLTNLKLTKESCSSYRVRQRSGC